MAASILEKDGKRVAVIASSEPGVYLRPGVSALPGELVIDGTGHAEQKIVAFAARNGYEVVSVGATRPICAAVCRPLLESANAIPATPIRGNIRQI